MFSPCVIFTAAFHHESMLVLVQQISLYSVCRAVSVSKNNSMLLNLHFQKIRNVHVFSPILQ